MSEPGHGSPAKKGANTDSEHVGEDNPIWQCPGFRIEAKRSWGLISTDIVSRGPGEATWLSDRHRIVHALTDIPGSIQSDGRPTDKYGLYREKIAFRPAGQIVRSDLRGPVRFIQILQSPDTYHNFAGELVRGGAVPLEPRVNVDDRLISRIALSVVSSMEGEFLDHVLADALNTALAVRIVRLFVDPLCDQPRSVERPIARAVVASV